MDVNSRLPRRSFLAGALTALSLKLPSRADAARPIQPLSFAFVNGAYLCNDHHDSLILYRESLLFLQDAIKLINARNPDFIICGGNQIEGLGESDANWQLFLDVCQLLKSPWSFILGDRDLADCNLTNITLIDKVKTFGPDWRRLGIVTRTPYWSSNMLPGVHVVGLDTCSPGSAMGYIGREQLRWLKDDLNAHRNDFTIVFSHHPLLSPEPSFDPYVVAQASAIRDVLQTSGNVSMVVSGHGNTREISREDELIYVFGPALAQYPCALLFFTVDPDLVKIEMCQVRFPALVKKAKEALIASNPALKHNRRYHASYLATANVEDKYHDYVIPLHSGGTIVRK